MTCDICFVGPVGPPDDHRYFYKQIGNLAERGWLIDFFSRGTPPKVPNVRVIVLSQQVRFMSRITGGLNLLPPILKRRPRALQICSVEFLPLALTLAVLTRIHIFYDCREDMPTSIMEHKEKIPIFLRWILSNATMIMERLGARIFAGISVSDQWIENKFREFGTKNLFYFPNYPRLNDFSKINPLETPKKYDFCILGSMSERTGVLEFIKALCILKNKGWNGTARLIGDPSPSLKNKIKRIAEAGEVKVSISGRVSYQEVPIALSECFVGVIPLLDMKKFHRNPATKMFEYAASGLYIVASDLPPQRKFLQSNSFAELVKPGDPISLSAALEKMLFSRINFGGDSPRNKFLSEWNADRFYTDMENYYKAGICK